jgi:hypothetical protein
MQTTPCFRSPSTAPSTLRVPASFLFVFGLVGALPLFAAPNSKQDPAPLALESPTDYDKVRTDADLAEVIDARLEKRALERQRRAAQIETEDPAIRAERIAFQRRVLAAPTAEARAALVREAAVSPSKGKVGVGDEPIEDAQHLSHDGDQGEGGGFSRLT